MARQRATTTADIIEAAARVFQTKGYRSSTIDDICLEAGISRPTIYKYIESKALTVIDIVPSTGQTMNRSNGWRPGRFTGLRSCIGAKNASPVSVPTRSTARFSCRSSSSRAASFTNFGG